MPENTYFFVDGSCLLGDISRIRRRNPDFKDKKLSLTKFYRHFALEGYRQFTGGGYRRFSIYFVNGENRLEDQVVIPNFKNPNEVEDFHIKPCGKKLGGSKKVDDWLDKNKAPQFVTERFNKSEKAVDTQICCDALQLAANNRIDRLFLYTNDFDFMPLLDVLKSLGVNASLFKLDSVSINSDLVKNSDSFCAPSKAVLESMFV